MPQLTKGARVALNRVAALVTDIRDELTRGSKQVKFNPDYTRDRIAAALNALKLIEDVMRDDVAPLLERQAPEYERRLSELEQRVKALEGSGENVIPLRRRAE